MILRTRSALLTLIAGLTSIVAVSSSSQATSILVQAQIDGWSRLVITPTSARWWHLEWAFPGTHNGCGCATYFTVWNNGVTRPTIEWYPWNTEYLHTFSPPLPQPNGNVSVIQVVARTPVYIIQQPSPENGYETVVEFNDYFNSDAWYHVVLDYADCTFVSEPPQSATVCAGQPHTLRTVISGGATSYLWRRNGIPIEVDSNPSAATPELRFQHIKATDSGLYDCVIIGACGTLITEAATVAVCSGDLTCDRVVDDSDFVLFAASYDTLLCEDPLMLAGCPADLNGDGIVDDDDFSLFVTAYDTLQCR